MPTSKNIAFMALLWFITVAATAEDLSLQQQLAQAQYNFDLSQAEKLLPEFEQLSDSENTEQAALGYATASLLVAELRRGIYEHEELEKKAKRQLGKDIDAVAESALTALKSLPDSSERYRLEADLLGPMIRSKFKGMKLQPRLEQSIEKALELDDQNPHAWVSKSRRPLFAAPEHGGDPALALLYLNRALEVNPDHVQALLFRGAAHTKLGNTNLAEDDWSRATELNPNTVEARDRLLNIEMPFE